MSATQAALAAAVEDIVMKPERFVGATELRKPQELLERIGASGETCFITENGRARAVLMDIHRYNAIMDLLEEAETPQAQVHEHRKHVSVRQLLRTVARAK